MKKLIQSIMAIPIAERIGRAFGQRSLLGTGAEVVTTKLVLRSFGAMLALGAVASGISWFAGKSARPDGGSEGKTVSNSRNDERAKGKSRKAGKASTA